MSEKKVNSTSQFEFQVTLRLNETEARALLEITAYGSENFLHVFYKNLGQDGLRPHEKGVHSLFDLLRVELPKHLKKFDDMRDVWKGEKSACKLTITENQ